MEKNKTKSHSRPPARADAFELSPKALGDVHDRFLKMQFLIDRLGHTTKKENALLFSMVTLGALVASLGRKHESLSQIQSGARALFRVASARSADEVVKPNPQDVMAVGLAISVAQECAEYAITNTPEVFMRAVNRFATDSPETRSKVATGLPLDELEQIAKHKGE